MTRIAQGLLGAAVLFTVIYVLLPTTIVAVRDGHLSCVSVTTGLLSAAGIWFAFGWKRTSTKPPRKVRPGL